MIRAALILAAGACAIAAPASFLAAFAMAQSMVSAGRISQDLGLSFMLAGLVAAACFVCAAACFLETLAQRHNARRNRRT